MLVYHKLAAEVTGPDGREWIVSVEPPMFSPPPGECPEYEVEVKPLLTRDELARLGGVEPEPFKYTVPSPEGIFRALNVALDLVPRRD